MGSTIVLYSSAPTKAVVGLAELYRVTQADPDELWVGVQGKCGVSRQEYDSYFKGAHRAFGVHMRNVERFLDPLPLDVLRSHFRLQPPQSFRYLSPHQVRGMAGWIGNPKAA